MNLVRKRNKKRLSQMLPDSGVSCLNSSQWLVRGGCNGARCRRDKHLSTGGILVCYSSMPLLIISLSGVCPMSCGRLAGFFNLESELFLLLDLQDVIGKS